MNGILMDGTTYKVRVVYNSLVRSFELRSGENEDYMISGRHERDLLGTGYAYQRPWSRTRRTRRNMMPFTRQFLHLLPATRSPCRTGKALWSSTPKS